MPEDETSASELEVVSEQEPPYSSSGEKSESHKLKNQQIIVKCNEAAEIGSNFAIVFTRHPNRDHPERMVTMKHIVEAFKSNKSKSKDRSRKVIAID